MKPISLSKMLTVVGWGNVFLLGWLLVARLVPAERTNMTVFWTFFAAALLVSFAYAASQTPGKNKPPDNLPPSPTSLINE